jgi:hypothetical protein
MAFSMRVFCREAAAPTLSEVLLALRKRGVMAVLVGDTASQDLLSPAWTRAALGYDEAAEPLVVRCLRAADPAEARDLHAEVGDFLDDLQELPPSPGRERVIAHLRQSRLLAVVEFPPGGVPPSAYEANGWLLQLFVVRSAGLVQCDGVGFSDEEDNVILRLG